MYILQFWEKDGFENPDEVTWQISIPVHYKRFFN